MLPVDACPGGAAPNGVEQLIGNVWEWTSSHFVTTDDDGRPDVHVQGDVPRRIGLGKGNDHNNSDQRDQENAGPNRLICLAIVGVALQVGLLDVEHAGPIISPARKKPATGCRLQHAAAGLISKQASQQV